MLSNELIELANRVCKQKSEEQTIELKAAHDGTPRRLYDTLSSFSNQDSGGIREHLSRLIFLLTDWKSTVREHYMEG